MNKEINFSFFYVLKICYNAIKEVMNLIYTTHYDSPLGDILLASLNNKLIGLWITGQKENLAKYNLPIVENDEIEVLVKTKKWLDKYFSKQHPDFKELDFDLIGSDFQVRVWNILCEIPYGKTITYNDIAKIVAKERGIKKMSAQAVGGAVGSNPISIIVPCHRVMGAHGNLTGYGGGLDKKIFLLNHEGVDMTNFHMPRKRKK